MKNKVITITICILALGIFLISYEGTTKNNHEDKPMTYTTYTAIKYNKKNKLPSKYKLTHYGWDCKGCRGKTATGYNIKKTYYYNDKKYGKVRIVAMCSKMKLGSVIRIKNYKRGGDIIAIVLDRGVDCGIIDLAVKNEKTSKKYGIQKNVKIDILRKGW